MNMFELRAKRISLLNNELKSLLGVSKRQVNSSVSLEESNIETIKLKNLAFHEYITEQTTGFIDKLTKWLDNYPVDRIDVLDQAGRNIAYALNPEPEEFIDSNGKHYLDEKTLEQIRIPVRLNYRQLFGTAEGLRNLDLSNDETPFEKMVDFKNLTTELVKSNRFLKIGKVFIINREAGKELNKLVSLTVKAENCIDEDFEKLKDLGYKLINTLKSNESIPLSDKPNLDSEELNTLGVSFTSNTVKTIESCWFGNTGSHNLAAMGVDLIHVLKDPLLIFKPNENEGIEDGLHNLVYNSTEPNNIKLFKTVRLQVSNITHKWHDYNRLIDRVFETLRELLSSKIDDFNLQVSIDIIFLLNEWNLMLCKLIEFYYHLLVNIEQNIIYIEELSKVLLTHKTIVQQYQEKRLGK